jgi:hypothetical protein
MLFHFLVISKTKSNDIQYPLDLFLKCERGFKSKDNMIREKQILHETLKARDYNIGEVVFKTAVILSIADVHTKFNEDGKNSTLLTIQDEATDKIFNVFVNNESMNNLIDKLGADDQQYSSKLVRVICNDNNYLKAKQLVIEPIV